MTITSPPRPPRLSDPIDREELEALVNALIEEARQRTRRRRQKYAALAVAASAVAVGITTILERSTGEEGPSLALAARSSVAQGASSQIAFITGPRGSEGVRGELYVVNANGSGLRLVAQNASTTFAPEWSPDRQKLAFERPVSLNPGIYLVNVDGSGLRRLANGQGAAWSPDGQRIAFERWIDIRGSDIFVMNADGSGQRRLTRYPKPDAGPDWSPDGQKIAFKRDLTCGNPGCTRPQSGLYVMNADGSGQQNLTPKPTRGLIRHAWSPDGQKIVFLGRPEGKNWEIYVINADGSGLRNLSHNPSHDLDAAWSPDGRRIVFKTLRHGNFELYVMNADGTGQRRLTRTHAANESHPSWSPDGQKIAFTQAAEGNFELYVMNADGSGHRRLTPNSPVDRWVAFSWSP